MQGSDILALRKIAGLTQGQLASAVGLSKGYVGDLERGTRPIDDKLEAAIRHATAPVQFWAEARLRPDFADDARRLIDDLAQFSSDGEVVGIVRLGDGRLMLGIRPVRGEAE